MNPASRNALACLAMWSHQKSASGCPGVGAGTFTEITLEQDARRRTPRAAGEQSRREC